MRSIELSGTPLEIGRQYGAAFGQEIQERYELHCVRTRRTPDKLPASVMKYVEQRCPDLLEEMDGLAQGAGLSLEQAVTYNHFNVMEGCTPIFFRDSDAGPLLAQNLDATEDERHSLIVRVVRPRGGYAMMGPARIGTVWIGTGMNEKGLCCSGVSARCKKLDYQNGTHGNIVNRDVLQHCANVDEAFERQASHTVLGKHGVPVFADASGKALRIERDNLTKIRLEPQYPDFGFATGIYETGRIEQDKHPVKFAVSTDRAATLRRLYENHLIDFSVEGMKRLLRHHCSPGSICRHTPWQPETMEGTQCSRIMIARQLKMLIAEGPPCRNDYVEHGL